MARYVLLAGHGAHYSQLLVYMILGVTLLPIAYYRLERHAERGNELRIRCK